MPSLVTEDTVQIILLVLESKSRRFELLQLEFDRNALVHEILSQIPDAATEDVLRRQSYGGICSVDGSAMAPAAKLGDCIRYQNEVKVAIPAGLSAKDCAAVAAPILNDDKVKSMLAEAAQDAEEVDVNESREKKKPKKSKSSKKSKTKSSEDRASKKKSSRSSRVDDNFADSNGATQAGAHVSSNSSVQEPGLISRLIQVFMIPVDYESKIGKHKVTHVTAFYAFLGFLISVVCTEIHLTMPLRPGSIMHSGDFIRRCGCLGIFRGSFPGCSEMSAVMDEDSFLNVYEVGALYPLFGQRKLLYRIVPENSAGMTEDGLYVGGDGTITIGGKEVVIEVANGSGIQGAPKLSPWPFMNNVELTKKRKNILGRVIYKPI